MKKLILTLSILSILGGVGLALGQQPWHGQENIGSVDPVRGGQTYTDSYPKEDKWHIKTTGGVVNGKRRGGILGFILFDRNLLEKRGFPAPC